MATSVRSARSTARRVTSSLVAAGVATIAVLACTVGISAAAAKPATARPAAAVANLVKISTLVSRSSVSHPSISLFCSKAETGTKAVPSGASAADTANALQAAYNNYKSVEPYVLANSPAQIKPDVQTVFNFADKLWAVLAQAHFNFMKVSTSSFMSLATANEAAVTKASNAITAWLKANCPGYKS